MTPSMTLPQERPARFRLPLTAAVAAGLLAIMVIGAQLVPAAPLAPDMSWRGNAGNPQALR